MKLSSHICSGHVPFRTFNEHPRADRAKRDQIDEERIKSHLERVVRGTVEETLNALPADVRDSDHRALSAARELGRGGTDRDVPGWGVGTPGRGHHGGIVGDGGIALDGVGTWRNRPIEGEHPNVYLDGIVLKQLGRRGAQRLASGCNRRERERLSGDSRHLRGGGGGQEWLSSMLQGIITEPSPMGAFDKWSDFGLTQDSERELV